MVKINGEEKDANGINVRDFLTENGYSTERIAVEINGDILPKCRYTDTILHDGDEVEIVSFVGGG